MKKGFTLIEAMVVIGVIILLALMAIPNLLSTKVNAAQVYAQAALGAISVAYERYASDNAESYNETLANLADSRVHDPVYLKKNYAACTADNPCQSYSFTCVNATESYTCTATGRGIISGKADNYQVITGGSLTSTGTGP